MTHALSFATLASRAVAVGVGRAQPFKLTLSLTDRCDCRCQGCRIWEREKRPELAPEEIERLFRDVPSLLWANLTGGEVFLREDVVEIARAIRRAAPRLAVLDFPTTGQRTERIVRDVGAIARLGIPRLLVTLSVEGPPEHHDRVRGRQGAFDRMVETFCALRTVGGVKAYLGLTLTEANATRLEETLAAVRQRSGPRGADVGWRDLHLNVWVQSSHYYANVGSDVRAPTTITEAVRRAARARARSASAEDRIEATYLRLLPAYLTSGRSPIPCRSLSAGVFVGTNGDVFPCTVWGRRLGNVRETPLSVILRGEAASAARATIARDACPGCWSPCEAYPTIVASAPRSLLRGARDARRRGR